MREAALLLRSRPLVIDVKKMAPDDTGAMKKLPEDVRAEEGRALARLGDGGWHPEIQAGLREGRFSDELVTAAADLVRAWAIPADWIAAVPARRAVAGPAERPAKRRAIGEAGAVGGDLVSDFAARLAAALGKPFAPVLERAQDRPPQREMANSAQQVANVRGAFRVAGELPPGACLLVDDVRFSGWTLAMTAGQLRRRGAAAVFPLALATAF